MRRFLLLLLFGWYFSNSSEHGSNRQWFQGLLAERARSFFRIALTEDSRTGYDPLGSAANYFGDIVQIDSAIYFNVYL